MLWQRVEVPHDNHELSFLKCLGVKFNRAPSDITVTIVGGGLAGLIAGFEAEALGFDVQIIEGRTHRNGGRIHTKTDLVPGLWAEAGPEFISPAHSIFRWYTRKFGLSLIETTGMELSPFTPILPDERICRREFHDHSISLREILIMEASRLSLDTTIFTEELERIDRDTLWELVDKHSFPESVKKFFETHFEFENGINPRKIGLLPYLILVRSHQDGFFENLEKFRIDGGLSQLTHALENKLYGLIMNQSAVKKIIRDKKFTLLLEKKDENNEKLETNSDVVILTVPPRLWDSGKLIDMMLPSDLIPQMGDSIKVLIRVPREIKVSTGILPSAFLERDTLVQAIWESGIGENNTHKIITIMCGGSAAERLTRMNQQEATRLIIGEIGKYYPELLSLSSKGNFYFKDWGRRKLTGCGYGCPAPYELTDFRPELEEMLPQNLYLCGEWNSWEMWGYMEGAIRSALTTILKICRTYGAEIPAELQSIMVH